MPFVAALLGYTAVMSRPVYRLSSGVVVVRETADGYRFLMLRAFRNWDFPKGIVESEEEPCAAALREVEEETGIADVDFAWGCDYFETGPYIRDKIARYYLGRTATAEVVLGVSPELGRPEHHEYRWVSERAAWELASPRVREVLAWAREKLRQQS
jgi:8-oxo-dGTP pyrophosphatase MutT (NUDIX family)